MPDRIAETRSLSQPSYDRLIKEFALISPMQIVSAPVSTHDPTVLKGFDRADAERARSRFKRT